MLTRSLRLISSFPQQQEGQKHEDVIKRLQFNMQFNMKYAVQAIQHILFLFENFNVKELCAI